MTFSTRRLLVAATLAATPSAFAQSSPGIGETVTVTEEQSTWIQPASGNGVDIPAGANGVTVNNGLGGVINGDPNAIITAADATIVNNSGTIAGSFNGLNFAPGSTNGVLNNSTTGVVASDSRAVNIEGQNITVNNAGSIIGTGNQRNGTLYTDDSANNYTINNSGTIDAGLGNQGSGVALEIADTGNQGSLTNSGLIQGRVDGSVVSPGSGASADGLRLANFAPAGPDAERTFTGQLQNLEGGVISSESDNGPVGGFRAANGINFQGQLLNQGQIDGVANGVYFGTGDHTGGQVINEGLIASDSRAFNIDGSGLQINNSGEIVGTGNQRNGTVYADSTAQNFTLNNSADGDIDAGAGLEGAGFSVELDAAGNQFEINNSGLIQGRGDAGAGSAAAGDGIRLERTRVDGALDGTTTGLFTGTINNSGEILSEGANGTVGGFRAVNGVSFQGELNNDGLIAGVQNGVYFGNPTPAGGGVHTGGVVNNNVDGVISSDSRAFNADGIGLTVNNNGLIVATDTQRNGTFYADSTTQGLVLNNNATGVIDAGEGLEGAAFSVELSEAGNDFEINNSGSLIGRGDAGAGLAAAGDGIRLERERVGGVLEGSTTGLFTGTITNSGQITSEATNGTVGGFRAVNGTSFQGTLLNEEGGLIAGVQNGVYFGNPTPAGGGDHTGGEVINRGTISSDSRAFNLDGTGLTVVNSGDILATGRQRNGTFYVDGTADQFSLTNEAGGVISAAGTNGAGSGVSVQVGSGVDDIQTGSITNSGLIQGFGDLAVDAGVRLFTNEASATFSGDIVNTASGVITANTAPAVLVQSGVIFDGTLQNAGTISGGASLSTGDVTLESSSVLDLTIFAFDSFETFDLEAGTLDFGGTLNIDFAGAFVPEVGQTFDLFDFIASTGDFDVINSGFVTFDTSNLGIDGTVSVVSVPEPTSVALGAVGGMVLLGRRRRRMA